MSVYGYEQHIKRTLTPILTLTHMITTYSERGNVVRERTLICIRVSRVRVTLTVTVRVSRVSIMASGRDSVK